MRAYLSAAIVGILAISSGQAATYRNAVFSLTTPPGNSGCAAPIPSDYFESTDNIMTFWFDMGNLNAGDVVMVSWITSAGILDAFSNYQPLSSGGGRCFWLTQPLGSNSPAAVAGTWTYTVQVNSTVVFSKQIQVVGPNDTSINRGGVVNTASGVSRAGMIAPGSLISIYGNNLAPVQDQAPAAPLPNALDGVTVTFNGVPVGIVAIAPGEVDVQAPWGIPSDTALVQVNNNGVVSNVERVRVASADPGVFFDPTTGNNSALVYRFGADGSDGGWVSPSNPLLRGDTALILATGLGAVADPPPNFNSGNPDSAAALPVAVFFDGVRASNVAAGLTSDSNPLDVGVDWISATVPNEVPNGTAVPITVAVAAATANITTVPVGGSAPAVTAPSLVSISGYPAVNSGGVYNPASAISIAASGVYSNAKTYAMFTDGNGYSVTLPALSVYSDRVISMVPPYVNQAHQTTSGTVQCSIVQLVQGQILTSNSQNIQIAPLYAAPGATGHLTAEYLATLAQDARAIDGGYTYKQEISNGTRFRAVSADRFANAMTTGLQPLVGGAEEMAAGNASSINFGSFTLSSNTVGLMDALIAAVLRENAKAYQSPPIVTGQALEGGAAPMAEAQPDSIVGSLASYFGKVAQCNMPWNQMSDEVNGTTSNCPSFGKALSTVAGAAADSLREAVDSTLEDAKRFAKGPGLLIGVLSGGEAVAVTAELVSTAADLQAATHIMLSTMESGQTAVTDQQAALTTISDELKKALTKDATDGAVKATGEVVGSVDEPLGQVWAQVEKDPFVKGIEEYLENLQDAPTTLEGPRDETNPDGTNSLDASLDNAPAVDFTGRVTNGSGAGLQNVGVALSDGNGDDTPIAVAATNTNGTFDLSVPAGAAVPSNALFQVTALDETGDIATFDGGMINLAQGPQALGTSSISYDNDGDGDDDSDGSLVVLGPAVDMVAGQDVHSRTRRTSLPYRARFQAVKLAPGFAARPGGLVTRQRIAKAPTPAPRRPIHRD